MRVKLLNNAGYLGLDDISYPVELPAKMNGSLVELSPHDLVLAGADKDLTCWLLFVIGEDVEIIEP